VSSVSGSPAAARVATAAGFGPGALLTPANLLTLARIAATPPFLWFLTRNPDGGWMTWLAWFALCATDLVDGKLARRHGATRSGAFLDPLADKILVLGAFAVLVAIDRVWWLPALLIAAREVVMSWYRSWIARRGVSVPANKVAKVKTWVQCIAIGLVIFPSTADHPLAYGIVVWLAVLFTLGTGLQYAIEGRRLAASLPAPAS
jgi:CDP-diacylglycerol--glycerol-3-phosphate 3-phosphatidyltransferase